MIPLVILVFVTTICVIILALGYIYRTSFPMSFMWFITGAIFLLLFVVEDSIGLDDRVLTINASGSDFIASYEDNVYPIKVQDVNGDYTLEPTFLGIMLIVLSLAFIMVGILIERT
jgi:hypothetical protein